MNENEARPRADLAALAVRELLVRLSTSDPVPGGGSAAALAGAMGASLVSMVAALTVRRAENAEADALARQIGEAAGSLRDELVDLAEQDSDAYQAFVSARRLPRETDEQRIARTEANVRREAGFVQAARLSGNGEGRILLTQILPNIMPIMIVQMSLTMGYAILNAAGLSFIGLGVRPPDAEWGIMVAEGAAFMVSGEWWIAFCPGLALMIAVFCFNLLGDGLRDIVDPQRRT